MKKKKRLGGWYSSFSGKKSEHTWATQIIPPDLLLLDRSPIIGPIISRSKLDKLKNCWNKSFRSSKILTLLYQQFSNLLISQRDTSGPRLKALSNNRWSWGTDTKWNTIDWAIFSRFVMFIGQLLTQHSPHLRSSERSYVYPSWFIRLNIQFTESVG